MKKRKNEKSKNSPAFIYLQQALYLGQGCDGHCVRGRNTPWIQPDGLA